jgi:23S rRNA (guanosine2251-2'-O)-methyltransferase
MSNPKRYNPKSIKHPPARQATAPGRTYWLYGLHAVKAALSNKRRHIRRAVATSGALERLAAEFEARKITPDLMSAHEVGSLLAADAVHQGVALEVQMLPEIALEEYLASAKSIKPLILLDQVTDPHNVGAILRSAAAFGVGAVITPRDHAPQETAVMAKASSGGIELVPLVTVTNLSQCMETLKKQGYWCVGLEGEAKQTMAQAKLSRKTALILGTEGKGLRRLTAERCDLLVKLPISAEMESLNVSNAAAIALYIISQASA